MIYVYIYLSFSLSLYYILPRYSSIRVLVCQVSRTRERWSRSDRQRTVSTSNVSWSFLRSSIRQCGKHRRSTSTSLPRVTILKRDREAGKYNRWTRSSFVLRCTPSARRCSSLHPRALSSYPRRIEQERSKNSGPYGCKQHLYKRRRQHLRRERRRRLAAARDYTTTPVVVAASTRKHSRKHFSRHVPSIRVCTSRITVHLNGSISSCGWYSNIHERRIAR